MNQISVGVAVGAGFRLIAREPAAFAVWCVVTFVLYGLPQALISSAMMSMAGAISAGDASVADFQQVQAQAFRYQPISYLSALALLLVLPPAVFRAILRPEERGFQFLRIGAAEFWTLLITIVITIAWFLAMLLSFIPIIAVAAISTMAGGGSGANVAAAGFTFLLFIPAFGVSAWLVLRLSLAPVMAFADRTFRLTESWRLTKGHAWRMFVVALTLFALMVLAELVVLGVGFGALVGSGGLQAWAADPMAAMKQVGAPLLIAGMVVWSVLVALIYVIWMASWADIYRQLRPAFADAFD
jgi:hypothetical protein